MLKRIIFALSAAAVMMLSGSTVAFAGNTGDTNYDFSVSAFNYDTRTPKRDKLDKTAVYVYVTYLQDNSSVNVRALGMANDKGTNLTENGTTGSLTDHVICRSGIQYSVHSQIYEKGHRTAAVAFQSKNAIQRETVKGKWSPDSTRTYTHAWN